MKLPVCTFDIESDMLCPNCQAKLDRGEITEFDIEFSKWLLQREKDFPLLESLNLQRAVRLEDRLILVVKKKSREILEAHEDLMSEIEDKYGNVIIVEGPPKLRAIVRSFIQPAIEIGVNSLYLPDGSKESIVMLKEEDRERLAYTKDELRAIVSAVMGESVLFEFQADRPRPQKEEEEKEDLFDQKMRDLGRPPRG
jgi:hypothetical protein